MMKPMKLASSSTCPTLLPESTQAERILRLSEVDWPTVRDLIEGVLNYGVCGSGKTSGDQSLDEFPLPEPELPVLPDRHPA
jgi:hypothetical protein